MKRSASSMSLPKSSKVAKTASLDDVLDANSAEELLDHFLDPKRGSPYRAFFELVDRADDARLRRILTCLRSQLGAPRLASVLEEMESHNSSSLSMVSDLVKAATSGCHQLLLDFPELNFALPKNSNLIALAVEDLGEYDHLYLAALRAALQTFPPDLRRRLNTRPAQEVDEEELQDAGKPRIPTRLAAILREERGPDDCYKEFLLVTIARLAPELLQDSHSEECDLIELSLRNGYYSLLPFFDGLIAPKDLEACHQAILEADIQEKQLLNLIYALPHIGPQLYARLIRASSSHQAEEEEEEGDTLPEKLSRLNYRITLAGGYDAWRRRTWTQIATHYIELHALATRDEGDDWCESLVNKFRDLSEFINPLVQYPALDPTNTTLSLAQRCLLSCTEEKPKFYCPGLGIELNLMAIAEDRNQALHALISEPEDSNCITWLCSPHGHFFVPPSAE